MNRDVIAFFLLFHFLTLLSGCTNSSKEQKPAPSGQATYPNDELFGSSDDRIVFAGISGLAPKFIDSGPDRGTGWMEIQTHEIRRGVRAAGFDIQLEWMTPARIEHEFSKRNPICTWPTELKNPTEVFKKNPDRIYSIPLDLQGDETKSILIRKEDLPRFKPFLNEKGDLLLNELLHADRLKTLLIRNKDYGELSTKLTRVNTRNDQVIRPEFQSHIFLEIIKDNLQLIEMLNANRFDYIFSDSIEAQDFVNAKLAPNRFHQLNYQTERITNIQDPRLKLMTISCAIHPLTLRAMPYFNQWIKTSRGTEWLARTQKYRSSIDSKLKFSSNSFIYLSSPLNEFRGVFEGGGGDYWYPSQQKYFNTLTLFPVLPKSIELPSDRELLEPASASSKEEQKLKWYWISHSDPQKVTLVSSADFGYLQRRAYEDQPVYQFYPPDLIEASFTAEQRLFLKDRARLGTEFFRNILAIDSPLSPQGSTAYQDYLSKVRDFTLFAYGLTVKDLGGLARFLPQLESLTVYGAGPEETAYLVSQLPSQLTHLNLTSCSLEKTQLAPKIKKMPLVRLSLSNSQVPADQIQDVLNSIPASIEELSLAYLRATFIHPPSFGANLGANLRQVRWPRLKVLDLENSLLSDAEMTPLMRVLGPSLRALKLGNNFLSLASLNPIFKQNWPNLKDLDLSGAHLVSNQPLSFPASVERLSLSEIKVRTGSVKHFNWPAILKGLDLSGTRLPASDFTPELRLSPEMENLNLASSGLPKPLLDRILGLKTVRHLDLSQNGISEPELKLLGEAPLKIAELNLSTNRIRSKHLLHLKKKSPELTLLDLSANPIHDAEHSIVPQLLGPNLEQLSLKSVLSLDLEKLAAHIPKSLRVLNLAGNQISDQDLAVLLPRLPKELQGLNLDHAALSPRGFEQLAQAHFPLLNSLSIEGVELDAFSATRVFQFLPAGVRSLGLGPAFELPEGPFRALLPQLRDLRLMRFQTPSRQIAALLSTLPRSLHRLRLYGINLQDFDRRTVFPPNLREIHLHGSPLSSQSVEAFSKSLPPSLERLSILASNWNDAAIEALSVRSLGNLYYAKWPQNPFTDSGLLNFFRKAPVLRIFVVGGSSVQGRSFEHLTRDQLKALRLLEVLNSPASPQNLLSLIGKLSPNVTWLNLPSSRLSSAEAPLFIQSLPKKLRSLGLRGVGLGRKARDALLSYARRIEEKEGVVMEVWE